MKELGGYFGLELPLKKQEYHQNSLYNLKNGRACLKYILKSSVISKVYLPFFSCHVILEPIEELGIEYEFYAIDDNLEIKVPISLKKQEYLIYVNFFGVKLDYVAQLELLYKERLIVDNTHSFFAKSKINAASWSFNSCRKFFGVPDGAYVFSPATFFPHLKIEKRNKNYTVNHLIQRIENGANSGYEQYIHNEELMDSNIELCSKITLDILGSIDYDEIVRKRRDNFEYYQKVLGSSNKLSNICTALHSQIPFCYPYLPSVSINKEEFWEEKIYLPIYWKECLTKPKKFKKAFDLAENTLYLPVDHRYNPKDLERVVKKIIEIEERRKSQSSPKTQRR